MILFAAAGDNTVLDVTLEEGEASTGTEHHQNWNDVRGRRQNRPTFEWQLQWGH